MLCRDLYEFCFWATPAVGVAVLVGLFRRRRADPRAWRRFGVVAAALLALADLVAPLLFYVILALIAGC